MDAIAQSRRPTHDEPATHEAATTHHEPHEPHEATAAEPAGAGATGKPGPQSPEDSARLLSMHGLEGAEQMVRAAQGSQALEAQLKLLEGTVVPAWNAAVDALDSGAARRASSLAAMTWTQVTTLAQTLAGTAFAPSGVLGHERARQALGHIGLTQYHGVSCGNETVGDDVLGHLSQVTELSAPLLDTAKEIVSICATALQSPESKTMAIPDFTKLMRLDQLDEQMSGCTRWYITMLKGHPVAGGDASDVLHDVCWSADGDDDDGGIFSSIGDGLSDIGSGIADAAEDVGSGIATGVEYAGKGLYAAGEVAVEVAKQAPGAVLAVDAGVLHGMGHIPLIGDAASALGDDADDASDWVSDELGADQDIHKWVKKSGDVVGLVDERVAEFIVVTMATGGAGDVAEVADVADTVAGAADTADAVAGAADTADAVAGAADTADAAASGADAAASGADAAASGADAAASGASATSQAVDAAVTIKDAKEAYDIAREANKVYNSLVTILHAYDEAKQILGVGVDLFRHVGGMIETELAHANDPGFDTEGPVFVMLSQSFDDIIEKLEGLVTKHTVQGGDEGIKAAAREKEDEEHKTEDKATGRDATTSYQMRVDATRYLQAQKDATAAKAPADQAAAKTELDAARAQLQTHSTAQTGFKAALSTAKATGDRHRREDAVAKGLSNLPGDTLAAHVGPKAEELVKDALITTLIKIVVEIVKQAKNAVLAQLQTAKREPGADFQAQLVGALAKGAAEGVGAGAAALLPGALHEPIKEHVEEWLRKLAEEEAPGLDGIIDVLDPQIDALLKKGEGLLDVQGWVTSALEPALRNWFGAPEEHEGGEGKRETGEKGEGGAPHAAAQPKAEPQKESGAGASHDGEVERRAA